VVRGSETIVPKQILRTLELTTLLVALDHAEEHGPGLLVPDPLNAPAECVYLAYIGADQARALAERVPHANVLFKVPGGAGKSKIVRQVYSKPVIMHVLRFAYPNSQDFVPFVRELASVKQKYWRVLDVAGVPVRTGWKGPESTKPSPRTRR
jgi:hypothetical protein